MRIDFYEVKETPDFGKQFDRLTKKKRFVSLPAQVGELFAAFQKGEFEGERIRHIDGPVACDVYKLRLPNPDANAGKSNGYRVIYLVVTEMRIVVFMTIYYKKEQADAPDKYIDGLVDGVMNMILENEEPEDE